MKKIAFVFVIVIVFVQSTPSFAQKKVGEWSIIPRLGLNLCNVSNCEIYNMDNEVMSPKARPDVLAGLEAEYQWRPRVGLSIGAFYSRQGCHYPPFTVYGSDTQAEGFENMNYKWQYLNIPVTVNAYATDFLSIRLGLQAGVYLDGKFEYDLAPITIDEHGVKTNGKPAHFEDKMHNMKPVVLSVPVGFGFEYENVLVDIRYCVPLMSVGKGEVLHKNRNQQFTLSVGYRF